MKKIIIRRKALIILVIVALGMLCMTTAALADQYPTNPHRKEALRLERIDWYSQRLLGATYWQKDFSLNVLTEPSYESQGVFEIVPETEGNFSYKMQVYDNRVNSEERLLYSFNVNEMTFTLPPLVMPTEYRVTLFCKNLDNEDESRSASYTFTLAPDANHRTLDDVVTEIVNSCRVPGDDWTTALNLHDYLTHHAYYDETYTNYGPDGVLYKHTGVRDSYSKAYNQLLRKAGIPVYRISCPAMDHAWNQICLDGVWSHVDVTWDDPSGGIEPESGGEKHHFFAISDDFISNAKYNHRVHYGYESPYDCPSMRDSAIIRLQEEGWPDVNNWRADDYLTTGSYIAQIQEQINQHQASFDLTVHRYVNTGISSFKDTQSNADSWNAKFYLFAMAQSFKDWQDADGNSIAVQMTFDAVNRVFHVEAAQPLMDLSKAGFTFTKEGPYAYAGISVEPEFMVIMNDVTLEKGVDYQVLYANNTCVGLATLTVEGVGLYTGQMIREFEIVAGNIGEVQLVWADEPYTFRNEAIEPITAMIINDVELVTETDYTVEYQNNFHAGTATVIVTGCGNFIGEITDEFTIEPADINDFYEICKDRESTLHTHSYRPIYIQFPPDSDQAIPIDIELSSDGNRLGSENYDVSYIEDLEAGEAVLSIIGKGDYLGTMICETKQLDQISISETSFNMVVGLGHVYDGGSLYESLLPDPQRCIASGPNGNVFYTLQRGIDYTLTYDSSANVGDKNVRYVGMGRFAGEKAFSYEIYPQDIQYLEMELEETCFIATGREKTPEATLLLANHGISSIQIIFDEHGQEIGYRSVAIPDTDFTVAYQNNVNPGTATVTLTGQGNYIGTLSMDFIILPGGTNVCRIPAALSTLKEEAFAGTNFTEFILPDQPVAIAEKCFSGLRSETAVITIPNGQSIVDESAFDGIEHLTIVAPESLTIGTGYDAVPIRHYCLYRGHYFETLSEQR